LTKVTSVTSEYKVRTRLVRWLRKQAEKAGQRLFARDDLIAIEHGWQITTRCGGFGRQYRDPRFDTLRSCPRCAGSGSTLGGTTRSGAAGGEPCRACAATGRVTVSTSPAAGEVRPDDCDSLTPVE
jgi:hypothetical protein